MTDVLGEVQRGPTRPHQRVDRVGRLRSRLFHGVGQRREPFPGDLVQDRLVVGEVVVRRLVADTGAAGHLAKADRTDTALGHHQDAGIENAAAGVGHGLER